MKAKFYEGYITKNVQCLVNNNLNFLKTIVEESYL